MNELLHGVSVFAVYLIPAAVIMLTARKFLKIPDELFRKILHFILLGAYFPFLFAFQTWWISAGFAAGLIVIIYPILALAGKIPVFSSFVNERKKGEFKSSMVLALATVMFSISICWGLFGDRLLTLACVYAWGVGDAFAALIGKQFGKHKVGLPLADPRKSWEGSAAMFVSSVLSVLTVLLVRGGLGFFPCLLISLLAAAVTTYVELITKGGLDTVTCPAAAMAVILPLIHLLGG
ncbi:MAG: phosphatidate cytidylyltransferase [Oscillospiraceae bacterium]|nr:phosphatidate cytidylyltransferase [Oscillospiraceae bacterium]